MLKIKLFPIGKKHQHRFRIVVVQDRSKLGGTFIDSLGLYDPHLNPPLVKLDKTKYEKWLSHGAQPSQTIRNLYRKL